MNLSDTRERHPWDEAEPADLPFTVLIGALVIYCGVSLVRLLAMLWRRG